VLEELTNADFFEEPPPSGSDCDMIVIVAMVTGRGGRTWRSDDDLIVCEPSGSGLCCSPATE